MTSRRRRGILLLAWPLGEWPLQPAPPQGHPIPCNRGRMVYGANSAIWPWHRRGRSREAASRFLAQPEDFRRSADRSQSTPSGTLREERLKRMVEHTTRMMGPGMMGRMVRGMGHSGGRPVWR